MFRTYIFRTRRCQVLTPEGERHDFENLAQANGFIQDQTGKPKRKRKQKVDSPSLRF